MTRALLVATIAAVLVGCDGVGSSAAGTATEALGKRLPLCEPYRDIPNAWGYCVYKHAGGFPTAADVEALCPTSGDWEDACRHAWVAGRMAPGSGFETSQLLEVCGDNADCSFELLDFRPEAEVTDQIAQCTDHAGRHADECVGHAMQRWWIAGPDAAEVVRVSSLNAGYPRKIGYQIAVSTFCSGVGTCAGYGENQSICETQVDIFRRRPETCPSAEWEVMDHNKDRGVPKGPGPSGPSTPTGDPTGPAPGAADGGLDGTGTQGPPATTPGQPPAQPPQPRRHQPGTIPPPP